MSFAGHAVDAVTALPVFFVERGVDDIGASRATHAITFRRHGAACGAGVTGRSVM